MSVINILYPNQQFRENFGTFSPNKNGDTIIFSIDMDDMSVIIWKHWKKLYILPDGRLIRQRLKPFASYSRTINGYVYDRHGTVTITGRYPDYWTDQGERVYLDADGIMKFVDPGPIVDRLRLKIQLQREEAARWRLTPKHLRPEPVSRRREPFDIFCDECQTLFQANHKKRRFCSVRCRVKHHRSRSVLDRK